MVDVISYDFVIPLVLVGLILAQILCKTRAIAPPVTKRKIKFYEVAVVHVLVLFGAISFWAIYSAFRVNPFANSPWPDETFKVITSTAFLSAPVIGVVLATRRGFRSVRLTVANFRLSSALGVLTSIVLLIPTMAFSPRFTLLLSKIDIVNLLALVYGAFSEELLFRGLLQTRLESLLGPRFGLVVTAVIFNFYHAPAWILVSNMTPDIFLSNVILSLPLAILLGYIAQGSDNILGSTIYHIAYALPTILLR